MTSESGPPESRRSAGRYLSVMGCGGVAVLIAGMVLGMVAYDKKYFPEGGDLAARLRGEAPESSRLWEAVSLIGFLLTLGGALAIAATLVAVVTLGVVRLVRRIAR